MSLSVYLNMGYNSSKKDNLTMKHVWCRWHLFQRKEYHSAIHKIFKVPSKKKCRVHSFHLSMHHRIIVAHSSFSLFFLSPESVFLCLHFLFFSLSVAQGYTHFSLSSLLAEFSLCVVESLLFFLQLFYSKSIFFVSVCVCVHPFLR